MSKRIIFQAKIDGQLPVVVGDYVFTDDEWAEELEEYDGDEASWLGSTGVDWAYEAASDKISRWAEIA